MNSYRVTGGLGRLMRFSKKIEVEAYTAEEAIFQAMYLIRRLIVEQDFGGDKSEPMLSKVINIDTIERVR